MCEKKISLGQFFTKKDLWLRPQVIDFIKKTKIKKALDPFAGQGDLLEAVKSIGIKETIGFDIDENLEWEISDSLKYIRKTESIIITNPPYLAKNSAKRKDSPSYKYFHDNNYSDLYQIGLEKCLENYDYTVAIIPETFVLTGLFTDRIHSITILEDNPFEDTDCPVCVVCFGKKRPKRIKVYKNDEYINDLDSLLKIKKEPINKFEIKFNQKNGNVGLRGVDSTDENRKIQFIEPQKLNYNLDRIKISSRSITVLEVAEAINIEDLIIISNDILEKYRNESKDILLASFKGNNRNNERRRRLDYKTARAIIEEAIQILINKKGE